MTYNDITNIINNNISANANQGITGPKLNYVLNQLLQYLSGITAATEITVTANSSIALNAKDLLMAFALKPSGILADLKIGTTPGGNDLAEYNNLQANNWTVIQLDYLAPANGNIYITGITSSTTLRIYKN